MTTSRARATVICANWRLLVVVLGNDISLLWLLLYIKYFVIYDKLKLPSSRNNNLSSNYVGDVLAMMRFFFSFWLTGHWVSCQISLIFLSNKNMIHLTIHGGWSRVYQKSSIDYYPWWRYNRFFGRKSFVFVQEPSWLQLYCEPIHEYLSVVS